MPQFSRLGTALCLAIVLLAITTSGCTSRVLLKRLKSSEAPTPNRGSAVVYFLRTRAYIGSNTIVDVVEGATPLGSVGNGTYFFAPADPGEHLYVTRDGAVRDSMPMKLKRGQARYLLVSPDGKIVEIGQELANELLPTLYYAIPEPGA